MNLPTGTVTFLLTDIAGSAGLWETDAAAMRAIVAHHDALAGRLVEAHGGVLIKRRGENEGLFAVFSRASDAVACACGFGCAIAAESFCVRMALHSGEAEIREGDYFGRTVNRCARLRAAAHGGQILVSGATRALVRETLLPGASLEDLGEVRLRDLARAERVFALRHPELPADFPPLRSLDCPDLPNNLPPQVTSFLGREREIERVKTLMRGTRLLTLSGTGGCGKTRLALQVAAEELEAFPDGVWLVELAPLSDPEIVVPAVARTLGVKEPCLPALMAFLVQKRLLLVLDNCEHVLTACAALADAVLRASPGVAILVTSREALGVAGEQAFRVPSLGLPDPNEAPSLAEIQRSEAVRLFVERARLCRGDFAVSPENASAIAELCRQLDGIPLALELAAARLRLLSVEEINARLNDRFRLLTGGSRTALPRQQTLRALIDWSYALLSPSEKILLHRLSVFAGGWTLEAAEEVCPGPFEPWETLDLLASLVDKSLVLADVQEGEIRYGLLETVRQYARDRLLESGEAQTIRHRHRDYFVAFAEAIRAAGDGSEQAAGFARLERDHDNLRSALEWCRAAEEGATCGLRLAAAVWEFWNVRGHSIEGLAWILEITGWEGAQEPSEARAHALNGAGILALGQGDLKLARQVLEESLAVWRVLGTPGIVHTLASLAYLAGTEDDGSAERAYNEEALRKAQEAGDRRFTLYPLRGLGEWALKQGDWERAEGYLQESVVVAREFGDLKGLVWSLNSLAELRWMQGDASGAAALQQEGNAVAACLKDPKGLIMVTAHQAQSALTRGDYAQARSLLEQVLRSGRENEDAMTIHLARFQLASVAQYEGDIQKARQAFDELRTEAAQADNEFMGVQILSESAWHAWWRKDLASEAMRAAQEAAAIRLDYLGREDVLPRVRCYLAWALAASGHPERAERLFRKVLQSPLIHSRHDLTIWCLEGLARALASLGRPEAAAKVLGESEAVRRATGLVLPPQVRLERDCFVATVREELGNAFWDLFDWGLSCDVEAGHAGNRDPNVSELAGTALLS